MPTSPPEQPRPHVVRASALMPSVEDALVDRYAAPMLTADGVDLSGVRVAVVGGGSGLTAREMDLLPGLGAIVHFGVGYDATDVSEATRRGVAVSNTPDVLTDCVADVAVGLVIDVMRGLSASDRYVRRGAWESEGRYPLTRKVTGARFGILGLGRIGLAVAQRLAAFDGRISYHSRRRRDDVTFHYATSPQELAAGCDVLVVTTPGGPGTAGLVDASVLEALGPDGYLVNVARGSVVDEGALVAALETGRIAGAGLDVFADEPHVPQELLDRDDVVLLPHLASGTVETRQAMGELVLANVDEFLRSGMLVTPVA